MAKNLLDQVKESAGKEVTEEVDAVEETPVPTEETLTPALSDEAQALSEEAPTPTEQVPTPAPRYFKLKAGILVLQGVKIPAMPGDIIRETLLAGNADSLMEQGVLEQVNTP